MSPLPISSSSSSSAPAHRWSRHDSGVSFSSPACLFAGGSAVSIASLPDAFSSCSSSISADSDHGSSPRSVASSSGPSPASSIASSPFLGPAKGLSLSPVLDQLSLSGQLFPGDLDVKPNATQLAAYASSVIRNEAYALLALAARIAPAAQPIVEDEAPFAHHDLFPQFEDRSESESLDSDDASAEPRPESRSNTAFRNVIDALSSLPPHGKIIVTGVGKSGLVGRKMVATFCSLGIQSVFLHPLEALHGDLGVICPCSPSHPCDALLMISHSGATAELMRLLPIVRPRVRSLIAVTRDPDSVLARACAGWLDAGTGASTKGAGDKVTDEADSALPAPTSSVVAALAIGDAVALSLSKMRIGWAKDGKARRADFLRCHPGGQLGIELGREGRRIEPSSVSSANASS